MARLLLDLLVYDFDNRTSRCLIIHRLRMCCLLFFFFFQAEDGIRDLTVTGVQTCALPISPAPSDRSPGRPAPAARSSSEALQPSSPRLASPRDRPPAGRR